MTAAALVALVTGCGHSGPSAPPPVHVSLTAPTNDARVSARNLVVVGSVDPPGAAVRVGGTAVHVTNSSFKHRVSLGWGVHAIQIEASAPGYLPTTLRVVVHNEPYRVTRVSPHGTRGGHATPAFVRRVNGACAGTQANLNSAWASARAFAGRTGHDPAPLRRSIDSTGRLLAQLQRIHVPASSAPSYAAFLASYQAAISGMGTILSDSGNGTSKISSDVSGLSSAFRAAEQLGYSLGLQVCTNGRLAH